MEVRLPEQRKALQRMTEHEAALKGALLHTTASQTDHQGGLAAEHVDVEAALGAAGLVPPLERWFGRFGRRADGDVGRGLGR